MLESHLENVDDKHTSGQIQEVEDISIEQEIECPCCHDVMTSSTFLFRIEYTFRSRAATPFVVYRTNSNTGGGF
jgi:hypothetical protein